MPKIHSNNGVDFTQCAGLECLFCNHETYPRRYTMTTEQVATLKRLRQRIIEIFHGKVKSDCDLNEYLENKALTRLLRGETAWNTTDENLRFNLSIHRYRTLDEDSETFQTLLNMFAHEIGDELNNIMELYTHLTRAHARIVLDGATSNPQHETIEHTVRQFAKDLGEDFTYEEVASVVDVWLTFEYEAQFGVCNVAERWVELHGGDAS